MLTRSVSCRAHHQGEHKADRERLRTRALQNPYRCCQRHHLYMHIILAATLAVCNTSTGPKTQQPLSSAHAQMNPRSDCLWVMHSAKLMSKPVLEDETRAVCLLLVQICPSACHHIQPRLAKVCPVSALRQGRLCRKIALFGQWLFARGLTQPVWDEGIPPDPISRVKSHLRSLYQYVNTFSTCAMTNAITAAMHGLRNTSPHPHQDPSSWPEQHCGLCACLEKHREHLQRHDLSHLQSKCHCRQHWQVLCGYHAEHCACASTSVDFIAARRNFSLP